MNSENFYDITKEPLKVLAFQQMLRLISEYTKDLPLIALDGVYGEGMKNAVMQFQILRSLPSTGTVDEATWNAAAEEYETILASVAPPAMIDPFPYIYGFTVSKGEKSDLVLLIQIMLSTLKTAYDDFGNIPFTGIYDNRTASAIRIFQKRNLLPQCNMIDLKTWNRLAEQYNYYVNSTF